MKMKRMVFVFLLLAGPIFAQDQLNTLYPPIDLIPANSTIGDLYGEVLALRANLVKLRQIIVEQDREIKRLKAAQEKGSE